MRSYFILPIALISAIYCGSGAYKWNDVHALFDTSWGAAFLSGVLVFFIIGTAIDHSVDLIQGMWKDARENKQRHQFVTMVVSILALGVSVAAYLKASGG